MNKPINAIILKKTDYQDDKIRVELFSEELGRIPLLVSRKSKKNGNHFNLFSQSEWHLTKGKVFFFQKSCDPIRIFAFKAKRLWCAYYLNELILRLIPPEEAVPNLYSCYLDTLIALHNTVEGGSVEWFLRTFESELLSTLGLLPDFGVDIMGDDILRQKEYFLTEQGIFSVPTELVSLKISGSLLRKIEQQDIKQFSLDELSQYKHVMRFLLQTVLGERPLQSRLWIEKLYQHKKD